MVVAVTSGQVALLTPVAISASLTKVAVVTISRRHVGVCIRYVRCCVYDSDDESGEGSQSEKSTMYTEFAPLWLNYKKIPPNPR